VTYSLHPGAEGDLASLLDFYRAAAGVEVAARFLRSSVTVRLPAGDIAARRLRPAGYFVSRDAK